MELTTLADRLVHARRLVGLNPRALSVLAGLDPTHVRLIEDGERPDPRSSTISKLAGTLGVTTDWLLDGRGELPSEDEMLAAVERARTAHSDSQEAR